MKRTTAAAIVALVGTLPAGAADIDLTYENFYRDDRMGRVRVIVKVTNNTARHLSSIFAECAFLDANGKALDQAVLIASNVAPQSSAHAAAWSAQMDGLEKADCRVSNFN